MSFVKNSRCEKNVLHLAVFESVAAVKAAIRSGCDFEAVNKYGSTALHLAVTSMQPNHLDIVKILVNSGSNVNATDNDGRTSLLLAANLMKYKTIKYLLDHGASIDARDNSGNDALTHCMCDYDLSHIVWRRKKTEKKDMIHCAESLLEYGAKINYNHELVIRSLGECTELTKLLLKYTALTKATSVSEKLAINCCLNNLTNDMRYYYLKCMAELGKMKETTIYKNFTFFDVLSNKKHMPFLGQDEVLNLFIRYRNDGLFPLYGGTMEMCFRKYI